MPDADLDFEEGVLPSDSIRLRGAEKAVADPGEKLEARVSAPAFKLGERAAVGGVGEVWRALQPSLARRIAVKRLHPRLRDPAQGGGEQVYAIRRKEFQQEALITAHLDHPAIVPVYDLQQTAEGELLLAMKMIDGESWEKVLRTHLEQMDYHDYLLMHLPILVQVSHAVAFAHSKGVIHRDIKPAQVMLGAFGEVLLSDWGLAILEVPPPGQVEDEWGELRPVLPSPRTATNPAGTPSMMAPEQTEITASSLTRRTDIFLLGATLYCVLTGTAPHDGKTVREAYLQAMKCDIVPAEKRRVDKPVPAALSELAMRCMSRIAARRPATVGEFITGIGDYLSGASDRRRSLELSQDAKAILYSMGNAVSTDAFPLVKPKYWEKREKKGEEELYGNYADCLNLLDRATAHWPQNPEIVPLRNRVLGGYIWAALENRDHRLARVLLRRLDSGPDKVELEAIVGVREDDALRQSRQRAFAISSAILFALILILGATKYIQDQRTAVLRAEQARADAEQVINFMLGSLRTELNRINQHGIMDRVGKEALAYFMRLPPEDLKKETLEAYAQTLRQLGDVRLGEGNLFGARQRMAESIFIRRQLIHRDDSPSQRYALAEDLIAVGDVTKRQGDYSNALIFFDEAESILLQLVAQSPGERDWQLALSDVHGQTASIHLAHARLDEARDLFNRQLAIRAALVEQFPHDRILRRRLATSRIQIGWIMRDSGDVASYIRETSLALQNRTILAEEDPSDFEAALDLGRAWYEYGNALGFDPLQLNESVAAFRRALELYPSLANQEPANAIVKSQHADALHRYAKVLEQTGETESSEEAYLQAAKLRDELVALDASNLGWQAARGVSHFDYGLFHAARGRLLEAVKEIELSREIRRNLVQKAPGNRQWENSLLEAEAALEKLHHSIPKENQ